MFPDSLDTVYARSSSGIVTWKKRKFRAKCEPCHHLYNKEECVDRCVDAYYAQREFSVKRHKQLPARREGHEQEGKVLREQERRSVCLSTI